MANRKIVIAPDKFKGSLEANQVAQAIKQGILAVDGTAQVVCIPMADGGEGTVDVMVDALGGEKVVVEVHDPFMRSIGSYYGMSADRKTAFIEMAKASGILLLQPDEYDTQNATTYGTGELIAHALAQKVERIYLGIGGSATTDAGIGMLSALGFEFLDENEKPLRPIGCNLGKIKTYSDDARHPSLDSVEIILMTDVSNPFYGERGAARVFSRQKGADSQQIEQLDKGLKNFAQVVHHRSGMDLQAIGGAGAGGGIAGGAVVCLNAKIRSGTDAIINLTGLNQQIADADLVITGEGKLDRQTLHGKVVKGVVDTANKFGTPVAILCGTNELDAADISVLGCETIDSVLAHVADTEQAMSETFPILEVMTSNLYENLF